MTDKLQTLRLMTPLDIARMVGADAGWDEATVMKVARGDIEPLSEAAKRTPLVALLPAAKLGAKP